MHSKICPWAITGTELLNIVWNTSGVHHCWKKNPPVVYDLSLCMDDISFLSTTGPPVEFYIILSKLNILCKKIHSKQKYVKIQQ